MKYNWWGFGTFTYINTAFGVIKWSQKQLISVLAAFLSSLVLLFSINFYFSLQVAKVGTLLGIDSWKACRWWVIEIRWIKYMNNNIVTLRPIQYVGPHKKGCESENSLIWHLSYIIIEVSLNDFVFGVTKNHSWDDKRLLANS